MSCFSSISSRSSTSTRQQLLLTCPHIDRRGHRRESRFEHCEFHRSRADLDPYLAAGIGQVRLPGDDNLRAGQGRPARGDRAHDGRLHALKSERQQQCQNRHTHPPVYVHRDGRWECAIRGGAEGGRRPFGRWRSAQARAAHAPELRFPRGQWAGREGQRRRDTWDSPHPSASNASRPCRLVRIHRRTTAGRRRRSSE